MENILCVWNVVLLYNSLLHRSLSLSSFLFAQLGGPERVAEMTGRRGMLVRAQSGKGVVYQARNT